MPKPFVRTLSGQLAKPRFRSKVVVYVEGDDDLKCFLWLEDQYGCKIEAVGGRPRCEEIAKQVVKEDVRCVVVIDGDYGILTRRRSEHRRVVRLMRYSCENYFFQYEVVEKVATTIKLPKDGDNSLEIFEDATQHLEEILADLVIYDCAAIQSNCGVKVLPRSHYGRLLREPRACRVSRDEARKMISRVRGQIDKAAVKESRKKLQDWTKQNRFVDVLCGHIVFGALRRLIAEIVHKRGHRMGVDNETLMGMLIESTWSILPSRDHQKLRNRLRHAIKDVEKARLNDSKSLGSGLSN